MNLRKGLILFRNYFARGLFACRCGVASVIILASIVCVSVPAFPQTASRILVLGSARGELSEIEDRIMREEIMRRLVKSGKKIVPVMEIEKEIQENALDVRKVSNSEMRSLSEKFDADLIVSGFFERKPYSFSYQLAIRNMTTGKIMQKEIPLDIAGVPGDYWQKLADGIAKEISFATDPRAKMDQNNR